jgi:hypothetical protein
VVDFRPGFDGGDEAVRLFGRRSEHKVDGRASSSLGAVSSIHQERIRPLAFSAKRRGKAAAKGVVLMQRGPMSIGSGHESVCFYRGSRLNTWILLVYGTALSRRRRIQPAQIVDRTVLVQHAVRVPSTMTCAARPHQLGLSLSPRWCSVVARSRRLTSPSS